MVRISNFHQNLHIFKQTAPLIDRDCQLGKKTQFLLFLTQPMVSISISSEF